MAECNNKIYVILPTGHQRAFLEQVLRARTVSEAAKCCACSERTILDWKRERFRIRLSCLSLLSDTYGVPVPGNMQTIDRYAHCAEAAKQGGKRLVEKYGAVCRDEQSREHAWRKWWNSQGRQQSTARTMKIAIPARSEELAEFVGIMLGDGGMSEHQVRITLHRTDDALYAQYVSSLIEKLFDVRPSLHMHKADMGCDLVISRKQLVQYCVHLGLVKGSKTRQQVSIPAWIKKDGALLRACVRGLVDTDGSIYTHSYCSKGRRYTYKRLSFTSRSTPLRNLVLSAFRDIELTPSINTRGDAVLITRQTDLDRYMKVFGTHNPKHLYNFSK